VCHRSGAVPDHLPVQPAGVLLRQQISPRRGGHLMFASESRNKRRRNVQKVAFGILGATAILNLLALVGFLLFIAVNGISAINWESLTEMPRNAMTEGGILPAILGTIYLSLGSILVAFPIGVGTAIYLNEFAKDGFWVRMIRQGVVNLAGVPSVVYGLFGLAFF